ncbi:hypothetical protein Q3G72_035349 [Acer saccharum]|nr:hypothetical protein Q3G72_035349 [Acer saccharum]
MIIYTYKIKALFIFLPPTTFTPKPLSSPLVSGDSSSATRPPPLVSRRSSSDARTLLASTYSPVLDFVVFLSKATGCSFSGSHPPPAVDFLLLACAIAALLYLFRAVLELCGYAVSNVAFLFAAVYFYRLAVVMLKDPEAAFRASVLFCFNPASIFYSSIYSESLYALFSVGGLYYLISGAKNIAVLWLALSGCARSNGVLNAGYFCFQTMHQAYDALFLKERGNWGREVTEDSITMHAVGVISHHFMKHFTWMNDSQDLWDDEVHRVVRMVTGLPIKRKKRLRPVRGVYSSREEDYF